MRDYQRIRNNPYYLPRSLYRRVLSVIRDCDRQRSEVDNIILETGPKDCGSHGASAGDPTQSAAIRIEKYMNDIRAVDRAKSNVPPEYMPYIFDNIRYGSKLPDIAGKNTWSRWKMKFAYFVAKNLKLI